MTEDEARDWVRHHFGVSRETLVATFADLVRTESKHQNLIARSTIGEIWGRHIVDSAQLLPLAHANSGPWLDIGTGAGFPGMVVALLSDREVTMVEPRKRRADFLQEAAIALGIASRVKVVASKIERLSIGAPFAVISARAVAALEKLFESAIACADADSLWLLPKGRNAQSEVEEARKAWQGSFHVEPSMTQHDSFIIIARKVRCR